MRVLSLHVEWLFCILHLGKRVENRTWAPPPKFIGKRIALHGTQRIPNAADLEAMFETARAAGWEILPHPLYEPGWVFQHGRGERPVIMQPEDLLALRGRLAALAVIRGHSTDRTGPWRAPGLVHWDLGDLRPIPGPILLKGAQRLWRLPQALLPDLVKL